jgi:putative polyketide hydroxylase
VWIKRANASMSTLDLFGRDFVLLTSNSAWIDAGKELQVEVVKIGSDITFPPDDLFGDEFGVGDAGACLVRPDGIIAWRSALAPDQEVLDTLRQLTGM